MERMFKYGSFCNVQCIADGHVYLVRKTLHFDYRTGSPATPAGSTALLMVLWWHSIVWKRSGMIV